MVPVDYPLPNVPYEILEELFIPDQYPTTNLSLETILDELETEALKLTGFLKTMKPEAEIKGWLPSKEKPEGFVTLGNGDPVVGVKVRVRRGFTVKSGFTDNKGFYRINHEFRYKINYSLSFENQQGFKIWGNRGVNQPAVYNSDPWLSNASPVGKNITIYSGSKHYNWCLINNKVVKYFSYCKEFGIKTPPSNLRILVLHKSDSKYGGSAPMLRHVWGMLGFNTNSQVGNFFLKFNGLNFVFNELVWLTKFCQPDIFIICQDSDWDENIAETTYHELAHASHFSQVGGSYWVKYINYIITYGSYGKGTGANAGICGLGEMWGYYMGARLVEEEYGLDIFYALSVDGWIFPDVFRRMVEEADYTIKDLYSCLTSDVTSPEAFYNKIVQKIGKNLDVVYTIFQDFGYDVQEMQAPVSPLTPTLSYTLNAPNRMITAQVNINGGSGHYSVTFSSKGCTIIQNYGYSIQASYPYSSGYQTAYVYATIRDLQTGEVTYRTCQINIPPTPPEPMRY